MKNNEWYFEIEKILMIIKHYFTTNGVKNDVWWTLIWVNNCLKKYVKNENVLFLFFKYYLLLKNVKNGEEYKENVILKIWKFLCSKINLSDVEWIKKKLKKHYGFVMVRRDFLREIGVWWISKKVVNFFIFLYFFIFLPNFYTPLVTFYNIFLFIFKFRLFIWVAASKT